MKKGKISRRERYDKIYRSLEPLRIAKKETIHTLASIGRNHKILRYPMMLILVVFIFIYNLFLYTFIHLKLQEKLARALALVLTVATVLTSVDVTVWAAAGIGDDNAGVGENIETQEAGNTNDSADAGDATETTDSVTPTDQETPIEPEAPIGPEIPTEPEVPTDPATPTNPESTTDPDASTDAEDPADAEDPTEEEDEEELEDEEEEDEKIEQNFQATVDGVTFYLHANEGVLPDNSNLLVEAVNDENTSEAIIESIAVQVDDSETNGETHEIVDGDSVQSYAITFTDNDGNLITNYENVSVSVTGLTMDSSRLEVYQYSTDDDSASAVDSEQDTAIDKVSFEIDENGIYSFASIYEDEILVYSDNSNSAGSSNTDYIYKMTVRKNTSTSKGEEIIFVPDSANFTDTYSVGLPKSSAILEVGSKQSGSYNKKKLNCYVNVIKSSKGFDWCKYGSLNDGLTKYNCYAGGVRNLSGKVYDYIKIKQEQNVAISLQKDGSAWSGQNVSLRNSGVTVQLSESSSGTYKSSEVLPGTHDIYVNGKDSGFDITVAIDMNNSISLVSGTSDVYHFTNTYTQTVDFYTLSVQMTLDGTNSTALNELSLNNPSDEKVVYSKTTDNGAWEKVNASGVTEFYLPATETNTYEIYTRRGATGVTYTAATDKTTSKTINYFTFTITTNLDGSPSTEPGKVSLRKNNNVIYTFTGAGGVYSEAFLEGTECDIFVGEEDSGEDIGTSDVNKVLEFVRYQVSITDDAPWSDALVELRDANGKIAAVLSAAATSGNTVTYSKIWMIDDYQLYVDRMDTHEVLSGNNKTASFRYYTAGVTVKGAPDSPVIVMTNGTDEYTFNGAGENWTRQHVMLCTDDDGNEKTYDVTVKNTVATSDVTISSSNKTVSLQFWHINYYKRDTSVKKNTLMRTVYVLDESIVSPLGKAKISGYSFSCWSETVWTEDSETLGAAFDFSQPITKDINLYANYEKPEIIIGSVVYTDANGNANGKGPYYKMSNLTISGFDSGDSAIKRIIITTSNTSSIKFFGKDSNISVKNGTATVSLSSSSVSITPGADSITITFTKPVSMAAAQGYLREKILVTPKTGTQHQLVVEVTDDSGEYVAVNGVSGVSQTSESITQLTGGTAVTLSSGLYYVNSNVTYTGNSGTSGSKYALAINGTVYIYIAKGCTLTATGGAAYQQNYGGGAGIYLPSGSTLVLLGSGTVSATGGAAASGGNGKDGGSATRNGSADTYTTGAGGDGGYGGAGAGAGIGTNGGAGGNGGSGGSSTSGDKDGAFNGKSGSSGKGGSGATSSIGSIYVSGVTVNAKGGAAGAGGSGGSHGTDTSEYKWGDTYRAAAGGAGGGGGGGGYAGANIGSGGTGGSGGGGGGNSGYTWGGAYVGGGGGGAGYGGNNGIGGTKGTTSTFTPGGKRKSSVDTYSTNGSVNAGGTAGKGSTKSESGNWSTGTAGSGGNGGGNSTANISSSYSSYSNSSSLAKSYTISFQTTTSTAKTPSSKTYYYGSAATITFPEYVDTNENVNFYGWQIKNYGKSATTGSKLTTSSERYQAGATITLDASTVGNITFVAITDTIGGIRDDDTNKVTIPSSGKNETYYTYNIKFTLNGEITTKGTIKVGTDSSKRSLTPASDGSYTLITTENSTKNIYVAGVLVGKTAAFSGKSSSTTIEYESIKVSILGKKPTSVVLSGNNAPSLTEEDGTDSTGAYTYSVERLSQDNDKGPFSIYVDGEDVDSTVSWGTASTVAFHTTKATIGIAGITASDIQTVELRDAAGNSLYLNEQASTVDTQVIYSITKPSTDTASYTLYINGLKTEETAGFSADYDLDIAFNQTTITTKVDGVLTDMGTVKFGDSKMLRVATGTYQLTKFGEQTADATVNGQTVATSMNTGDSKEINYYTLSYAFSDDTDTAEAGTLPTDENIYLSGTSVVVKGHDSINNAGKTFAGWKLGSKVYKASESFAITGTSVLKAEWEATDLSSATVTLSETEFTYNGNSQTPTVTVVLGETTLIEDEDYVLTYKNTNTVGGRSDSAGSSLNAINAGTVTITVTGKDDYKGKVTAEYIIEKKTISAENLTAENRTYDGTDIVELITDNVTLNGVVDGDDVSVDTAATGTLDSKDVEEEKYVQVKGASLKGTMASNYELEALELNASIYIDVTKKAFTDDMFSLAAQSVVYNGKAQEVEVIGSDMAQIDGVATEIMASSDYNVAYTNNIHTGTATVTITATDEGNYSGNITKTFTIKKAPLSIAAVDVTSSYGKEIGDISSSYKLVDDTEIFTEDDAQDLDIKAVTSVKQGYAADTYEKAVAISYNTKNEDYDVTTIAASHTVTKASVLDISAKNYTGVYDGKAHGISVTAKTYDPDEKLTIYYSDTKELTANNYKTAGSTNALTFTDAGTYSIYYFACSDNYEGAGGAATVTIARAPLIITAKTHTITYGADCSDISEDDLSQLTVLGLLGDDTTAVIKGEVSYSSNDYKKYDDVGNYTLTPSGLSADNYDIAYKAGSLIVETKKVTFEWPKNTSFSFTGKEQAIYASVVGSVNKDELTVDSYEDNVSEAITNSATAVGRYTAKVAALTGTKSANYSFDPADATASQAWSVTKADNEWLISPRISGWQEGSEGNEPLATAKFGNVAFTYAAADEEGNATSDYSETKPTTAGKYILKAVVAETDNFAGLEQTVAFTIAESGQTEKSLLYVQAENKTVTYGEEVKTVNVKYLDENKEETSIDKNDLTGDLYFSSSYKQGDATNGNVGEYEYICYGYSSDKYEIIYLPGTITVEAKEVELDWLTDTHTYNGKAQSITATVNADSIVNDDLIYVGSYEISATDANITNIATNAGSYTAKATSLSGIGAFNYKLPESTEQLEHTWKIEKAENEFVISPAMDGWTYGETASTPIATAKFGEVKFKYKKNKGGILDWSIFNPASAEMPTEAGEYTLIAEVEADENGNYERLESSELTFTIAPAEVVITAEDNSSIYGNDIAPTLYYSFTTLKGKISDDDKTSLQIELSTPAKKNSDVGVYSIEIVTENNSNINVTAIPGSYRILPADLTASTSAVTCTYDGKAHGLGEVEVTSAGKTVKNAEIYYSRSQLTANNYGAGSASSPTITNVGEETVYYYVTAKNYSPASGSCKVTINKKAVTVTASNAAITYGETATNNGVSFDGFIGEDTALSLGLTDQITYSYKDKDDNTYAVGSAVGNYNIIPALSESGEEKASNYSFSYISGKLTVEKKAFAEDMFSVSDTVLTYDKTEKKPLVTGLDAGLLKSSDYEITYSENVNAGKDSAKVTIIATNDGNYKGTIEKTFTINPRAITVTAEAATSVYKEDLAELKYKITDGSVVDGDDLAFEAVTSVKKNYKVGVYDDAISVSYDAKNTNYKVMVIPADYTVKAASLAVIVEGYEGTYDGKAHSATITAKTGALLTFASIYYSADGSLDATNYKEASTTNPSFTNAGTHHVYYYIVCENYEPVAGMTTVLIEKAPLTVTAGNASISYGDSAAKVQEALTELAAGDDAFTCSGLIASDTAETVFGESKATYTSNYSQYADAGEYRIAIQSGGLVATNYAITLKPGVLTVEPKLVSFTWDKDTSFEYSGSQISISATVEGTVNNDNVTALYASDSVEGNTASATAVGSYTAVVTGLSGSKASNYRYADDDSLTCPWEITKAKNSFTVAPFISNWTEGSEAASPIAAAKFGSVSFTYSSEENGPYSTDIPNDGKAGSYYMKAEVKGSINYDGLEEIVEFSILKKAPEAKEKTTITIAAKPLELTYGDDLDLTKLDSDDITVTGLAESTNLVDVVENLSTLTFSTNYEKGSKAGSYLLVPSGLVLKEDALDVYEIVYKAGEITVGKKQISLSWSTPSTFTYDTFSHAVTASVEKSELVEDDSISITSYETDTEKNITNTATKVGKYTAHAISFSGTGSNNYSISNASIDWEITKATAEGNSFTTELTILGWTYGENPSTPFAEAKYGTVSYQYSDSENGTYTATQPTNAGEYYVKAVVEGTEDYETITSDPLAFTIKRANVTIAADDITSSYGSEISRLSYQITGNIVTGDDLGISLSTTANKNSDVGEYPITVSYKENANYTVTAIAGSYFITADANSLKVTAAGYNGVYDGKAHGIAVTVTSSAKNSRVYYSETELTESNYGKGASESPSLTDAGSKTIYYYVTADNCKPVAGSQKINISKATLTVTANNATITYGDTPKNEGVSYEGFVGDDTAASLGLSVEYSYNYVQYDNAGSYEITPSVLTEGNYSYDYVAGKLTVEKKPVTFSWSGESFAYDGTIKMTTAEAVGLVNADTVSISYENNAKTHVGTYTAKVTGLSGDKAGNYRFENESTISKSWSIVKSNNYLTTGLSISDWIYGEETANPKGELAYGEGNFVYSDEIYGSYTASKPNYAGNFFVKIVADGTDDYNAFESVPVSFEIKKSEITVTADDIIGTVGDEIKELTYSISGSIDEEDDPRVRLSTTASKTSEAGEYPITVTVYASDNYIVSTVDGRYILTDDKVDFTIENTSCTYDGQPHSIKATLADDSSATIYFSSKKLSITSGFENVSAASLTAPTITDVGSLKTYYYVVNDDKLLVSGSKTVTINKALLTVTANDAVINMGENPKNAGVSFDGFVNGEDEKVVTGTVKYSYDYKKGDLDGEYTITPSGLTADNYSINYVSGKLTVLCVRTEIEVTGVTAATGLVYNGESYVGFTGSPTTSMGDAVTEYDYIYKDSEGNLLSELPVDAGTYTLTIAISSSNKYYAGETSLTFTIAKRPIMVLILDQAMMTGQAFVSMEPEYSGFIADANKDNAAIKTAATIVTEEGVDTSAAGTVKLISSDLGELTAEAAKNYFLSDFEAGKLTIFAKPATIGKGDEGSSVKLDESNSGLVYITVLKDEAGLPKTEIEADFTIEVAEALLTSEETIRVKNGDDALVYLLLASADDSVTDDEKTAISQLASGMTIGTYLDLSLFKKVGNNPAVKITEMGAQSVTIEITLPNSLKQANANIERTYRIIYVHDGAAGTIEPEYSDGVLTFEADKFSVYAIAYKDTIKPSTNPTSPVSPATPSNPASSSDTSKDTDDEDAPEPTTEPTDTSSKDALPDKKDNSSLKPTNTQTSDSQKNLGSSVPNKDDDNVKTTPKAEITDDISKDEKDTLKEAFEKLSELIPGIQEGPYIKVPILSDDATEEAANQQGEEVRFTFEIPKDLIAEGRTFYLMMVDDDGNIIILENESLEDGCFTANGIAGASYEIIYEDGKSQLADMISEDGKIVSEDGKTVTVKTVCFWHFMILIVTIIGAGLSLILGKKKKSYSLYSYLGTLVLSILFAILGSCNLDWIFAMVCTVAISFLEKHIRDSEEHYVNE